MQQPKKMDRSAEILRTARLVAGLTQRALAERAGTAQSVIARIETGVTSPSWDTLERLVAATGHSLVVSLEPATVVESTPLMEAVNRILALSPEDRLRELASVDPFTAEARSALGPE